MKTPREIDLNLRDRRAVEAAAAALRASLPVERIILFGSKARGEDGPESDIDMLVLTSRPLSRDERARVVAVLYPIQLEHRVLLSTMEISLAEWERGPYRVTPLRVEVDRDGVAA